MEKVGISAVTMVVEADIVHTKLRQALESRFEKLESVLFFYFEAVFYE